MRNTRNGGTGDARGASVNELPNCDRNDSKTFFFKRSYITKYTPRFSALLQTLNTVIRAFHWVLRSVLGFLTEKFRGFVWD